MANDGTEYGSLNFADLQVIPDQLSPGQRIALVRAEQRRAWSTGQRTTVEQLLERYPALKSDTEAIIDLAYSEFILRTERGETVDPEEYVRRFPQQAEPLRRQLVLHAALAQMTFVSQDTSKTLAPSSQTIASGPPAFESLESPSSKTVLAVAAEAFQTLMQAPEKDQDTHPQAADEATEVAVPGYEIISELGRGGMGVVYKARQHRLDRLVALKMILSGEFASKNDRDRFREEAIKLARVQHSNIVQIYEVSEHDNRPYFAMEYLDGGSLAKEIAGQPLTARIAARLMLSLANAVQTAHEKGIIHRDLKPGNILLTAGGLREASERGVSVNMSATSSTDLQRGPVAKITDFGLAKGMHGEESRTVSGAILGTPSYMAPEQARGESKSVGPAADIYALGAILYECLTGRPPFLAPNAIDTIYLVVHEEPVKPSAWMPQLPRDIETICLKCLEKDPAKRYLSAKALAEDLEAFLENRPIRARPVGVVERSIKWARRRPAAAALIGTLSVAAVALLAAGAWVSEQRRINLNTQKELTAKAEEARDEAGRERDEKEKQRKIATALADSEKHAKEEQVRLKNEAVKAFESEKQAKTKEEQARKDAETQRDLAQKAEKLAEQRFQFSRKAIDRYFTEVSEGPLLDEPNLEPLRKNLLGLARGFYEQLVKERSDDPNVRKDLAEALMRLGLITSTLESPAKGIELYQRALVIFQEMAAQQPGDFAVAANVARTHYRLGLLYRKEKQRSSAKDANLAAVDYWQRLLCEQPGKNEWQAELARSLDGLGGTCYEFKEYGPARDAYDRALGIRQVLADKSPNDEVIQRDLAVTLDNLGNVTADTNAFESAETYRKKAREIFRELVKAAPGRTRFRDDLARNQRNLGNLYLARGRNEDAVLCLEDAAKIWEQLTEQHSAVKDFAFGAAQANRLLAQAFARLKREPQADAALKKARTFCEALVKESPGFPEYEAELARIDFDVARRFSARGALNEAAENLRQSASRLQLVLDANKDAVQVKIELANALFQLGFYLRRIDRPIEGRDARIAESLVALQKAKKYWNELLESDGSNNRYRLFAVRSLSELARLELDQGRPQQALVEISESLKLLTAFAKSPSASAAEKRELRDAYWCRAEVLTALGQFDEALDAWQLTMPLVEKGEQAYFDLYRLATVAHTPKYADAAQSAFDRRGAARESGLALFTIARVLAISAGTASRDPNGNANEQRQRAEQYTKQAIESLQAANQLNYLNGIEVREKLQKGRDFEYVRSRQEFRQFLATLGSLATLPR